GRVLHPIFEPLGLLLLGDMQHEFENARSILMEKILERVDLVIAPLDRLAGNKLPDLDDQHVLVMRAVEDSEKALGRNRFVNAPEIVACALLLAWRLEGCHCHPDRTTGVEDRSDRAVLAAAVDPLQHHEKRSFAFRE